MTSIFRTLRTTALALAVAAALSACSTSSGGDLLYVDSAQARPVTKVAVLPFRNLTAANGAGDILSSLVQNAVQGKGLYPLMEESDISSRLAAMAVDPTRGMDTVQAAELARKLGVDAVIVGSVAEYGYTFGVREQPAVALALRMVRADGTVAWSQADAELGGSLMAQDSMGGASLRLVGRMTSRLAVAR